MKILLLLLASLASPALAASATEAHLRRTVETLSAPASPMTAKDPLSVPTPRPPVATRPLYTPPSPRD